MNIALIVCPSWIPENPPVNMALLASTLKSGNHEVKCFDLNIRFYNYLKKHQGEDNPNEKSISVHSWQNNRNGIWEDKFSVNQLFTRFEEEISTYINEILSFNPSMIGFTIYSISMLFSIELANRIKQKNSKVIIVFGGPACFPHYRGEILFSYTQSVEFICFGEGELALLNLANAIDKGSEVVKMDGFYHRLDSGEIVVGESLPNISQMDSIPFADFSDFNLDDYTSKTISINTSRGCINRCTFCNESPFWKKYRTRSAQNVFEEIVQLKHQFPLLENLWFSDSLINGDLMFLNELCDLMIRRNINVKWTASAYVRKDLNLDLLVKLKKSGCEALLFGLESGSDVVLKKMNKGYSSDIAKRVLIDSVNANITTFTNLIIGHPGENLKYYLQTVRYLMFFLNPKGIKNTTFNACYVLNGSTLKQNLKKFDIIHGFVDSWYSADMKNNRKIREIWLHSIEKMSIYKHYKTGKIGESLNLLLMRNKIGRILIYIFHFEFYIRIKSFLITRNFKKEHNAFFNGFKKIQFKHDENSLFSKSQQWKINYLTRKIEFAYIAAYKKPPNKKLFENISDKLKTLLSTFDPNQVELVLDNLFPMNEIQLIELIVDIDDEEMFLLSSLIKSQLKF